jgi:hypothetical protein
VEREERRRGRWAPSCKSPGGGAAGNRQEALEARNRAVGDAWLQKMQAQAQVQTPTQTQMQTGAGHAG